MKEVKQCLNCLKGKIISVNGDVICPEKGPVSPDFCCSKHVLSNRSGLSRKAELKCINCENFMLDLDSSGEESSIGLCQMFSVRKFDGREKKACSKFTKKHRNHFLEKTACTS